MSKLANGDQASKYKVLKPEEAANYHHRRYGEKTSIVSLRVAMQ